MASISGTTSSLNSTLRGFGGMASGIDRDSIIEQMSLGTTTKIQNQKNAITNLTWKQEAFRGIINQILDLQDNYLSYSASSNVMDSSIFAKNVITANGDEKITKYISASGSSNLLESVAVRGVANLATAANVQSGKKGSGAIEPGMSYSSNPTESNLAGRKLTFGSYGTDGRFKEDATFTFPTSYTDADGKVQTIEYVGGLGESADLAKVADQLNESIKANKFLVSKERNVTIQFDYDEAADKLNMKYVKVDTLGDKFEIGADVTAANSDLTIRGNSSALSAMGFKADEAEAAGAGKEGLYTLDEYNAHTSDFSSSAIHTYDNMAQYLKGKKFTIAYGGQSKTIELITEKDIEELKQAAADGKDMDAEFAAKMQAHLNRAFGTDKIAVGVGDGGKISFNNALGSDESVITINSGDVAVMKQTGLDKINSNKISTGSSLFDNRERLGFDKDMTEEEFTEALKDFSINDVHINVNANMTVSQFLSKINSSDAGVKATYLSTSNKFTLVNTETGSGREISVDGAASTIFGGSGSVSNDGKDAVMYVDYGTGTPEKIVSSTNTFDLDGLKITASGTFGVEEAADGSGPVFDRSESVTFHATADVDKTTEKVKKFLEDYNALVKAINDQITTKPNGSYGPLTDEQKDEMTETSIENWEKKAKEGLLYNNSVMRDLSMDVQGVLNKILGDGVSYDDLQEMGISMSEDPYDGGTLKFDEAKFKAAMEQDPEKVGNIFTGGNGVSKGLSNIISDTTQQYATRYSYKNEGSYGRLVEEAGSEKLVLSLQDNTIYNQLKDMQENLKTLQSKLKTEQDRYIQMFTTMEKAISSMNSQSSYLSSLTG